MSGGFLSKLFPVSVPLPRPQVPENVTRICVSGFGISHHTGRARAIATAIAETYPDKYETYFYFDTRGFRPAFLENIKDEIRASNNHGTQASLTEDMTTLLNDHTSSPFCWLETKLYKSSSSSNDSNNTGTSSNDDDDDDGKDAVHKIMKPIGGRDQLCAWALKTFDTTDPTNESFLKLCESEPSRAWREIKFDATTPGTAKSS